MKRVAAVGILTLVAFTAAAPVSSRVEVSIDHGWRWLLGAGNDGQCTTPFNVNLTNIQCSGLSQAPNIASPQDCQAACCSSWSCQVWQFCPGGKCGNMSCWIGDDNNCGSPWDNGWISFATNSSAPPGTPSPALPSFDDSNWTVVDIPHDFIIDGEYSPDEDGGQAFLPKNGSWYRHHMSFPSAWQGSTIELYVEGAFSVSYWYLNGVSVGSHAHGYTSVIFRLDNVSINYDADNVLAVYTDATQPACTGWWYEGGGLYRHARIVVSNPIHGVQHGLFAPSYLYGEYHSNGSPAQGLTVDMAYLSPSITVGNDGDVHTNVSVVFTVYAADGVTVVGTGTAGGGVPANDTATVAAATIAIPDAELWSIPRPYLHTVVAVISVAGATVDSVNASIGFRSLTWDPNTGLYINQEHVKMRGFCNHNSFTGVGVAVPDRVNLFRVQAVRGLGGNAWRTSHNAPAPVLMELTDLLGIVVLDENRVFEDAPQYLQNMADLVTRDRNHPSVIFWSFCNEGGCGSLTTQPTFDFKWITDSLDGTRDVTANMIPVVPGNNMSQQLDIQGFSHRSSDDFLMYHSKVPMQPLVASECCSCETQRGEDADLAYNKTEVFFSNMNAPCVSGQTQATNGLDFVSGTFVWTAWDYYGEPGNWPHISSSFGSYDLAGFPKAPVWWYRSWWLANVSMSAADRPPVPNTSTFVHIVESWQAPTTAGANRTINVLTNAPQAQLVVNGVQLPSVPMSAFQYVTFSAPYAPGTITANALDASGVVLASSSKSSWGAPVALVLSVDAPNPVTGTGAALYYDGQDVALVRATVVDANNQTVHDASISVTFSVLSGPGMVLKTGNGDPSNQESNALPQRLTYHGLVRALIRVNSVGVGSAADRALLAALNRDAGAGPLSSSVNTNATVPAPAPIVVYASAPGLMGGSIAITVSQDPSTSVMATAAASVASAYVTD